MPRPERRPAAVNRGLHARCLTGDECLYQTADGVGILKRHQVIRVLDGDDLGIRQEFPGEGGDLLGQRAETGALCAFGDENRLLNPAGLGLSELRRQDSRDFVAKEECGFVYGSGEADRSQTIGETSRYDSPPTPRMKVSNAASVSPAANAAMAGPTNRRASSSLAGTKKPPTAAGSSRTRLATRVGRSSASCSPIWQLEECPTQCRRSIPRWSATAAT